MKTILASTYAINPFNGSEDGMGWNFIYQIARYQKVIAITRENNQADIERYMKENPDPLYDNIRFVYFDLPYWMRFWKKGNRGAMLYFWLWQKALPGFIEKQDLQFDIVHNVNFHNDWTPSYLWKLNKPFVWGHIGHHPSIPTSYLHNYKRKYFIKEQITWFVKKMFWNFSPALKKTVSAANHIFCMNSSVPKVLNLKNVRYSISPSVATQDFGFETNKNRKKFTLISAGRLVPLKGFDISIHAFAEFLKTQPNEVKENCELLIIGRGPELETYTKMAHNLNIQKQVRFIPWMQRNELMNLFKQSSAFIFPSHEGAGMVVAEALSFGLPIICLDNYGPGEYIDEKSGFAVSYNNYNQTVNEIAVSISKLVFNPQLLETMSRNARKLFEQKFHWDVRGFQFQTVYSKL